MFLFKLAGASGDTSHIFAFGAHVSLRFVSDKQGGLFHITQSSLDLCHLVFLIHEGKVNVFELLSL